MNRIEYCKNEYNYNQFLSDMGIEAGQDAKNDIRMFLVNILELETIEDPERIELIKLINSL